MGGTGKGNKVTKVKLYLFNLDEYPGTTAEINRPINVIF